MKKYSIVLAMLVVMGVAISSCSASAKVGTKNHEVGVGGHVK